MIMPITSEMDYFQYGQAEIAHLRKADRRMAAVIDRLGFIRRRVIPDLFTALVHSITGQQISSKAHETVWKKFMEKAGNVSPETILSISPEELQSVGISFRKVKYIQNAAQKTLNGEFNINSLNRLTDAEVCSTLTKLDGIGVWSAEMLMLFSMQRPNILSFGDFAIQRGLCMLYGHQKIDRPLFEKYRRRFSPFCSVASLYLWAVAGGAIEDLSDKSQDNSFSKKSSQMINIQIYHSPCGDLLLGSFDNKLCLCNWANGQKRAQVDRRLQKLLSSNYVEATSDVIRLASRQLDEYFSGKRKCFDIPLLFVGTDFQKLVWQKLLEIRYGATVSYGEQARLLGMPKAVRAIANANGANAISIFAPCHRVIGGDASLTGYGGGLEAKKYLLELEQNPAGFFKPDLY
jgi:DNA-3-methyladenine glycosylase II